jgi:UDP-N-acetylglucosamine 2-epimerase
MDAPFPEEMNRVVIDRVALRRYAPTPGARDHLLAEGVATGDVVVTGNTAIDALLEVRGRLRDLRLPIRERLGDPPALVLVTAHRRESFGAPLEEAFGALDLLARRHPDLPFVYPVHPNPNVVGPAKRLLTAKNLHLVDPVGYGELVWLLDRARLALTDSGGIQEEGATLGVPVLVLREVTERPELIVAGAGLLVGTDRRRILDAAERLLSDDAAHAAMARPRPLFGDGKAGERIAADLAGRPLPPWEPPPVAPAARPRAAKAPPA